MSSEPTARKSLLETLNAGTSYLEKNGVEDARRNMQLLLAHQLNCTRTELYLRFDEVMQESDLAVLRDWVKRRSLGEPLQHLLGTVEFYRREFKSDARALIPRPETEELVELALSLPIPEKAQILDVGTGSGVLGLSLAAERPKCYVTMVDISPEALSLARENADYLAIPNARAVASDLFSGLEGQRFDLIVANLPYVAETERPHLARELAYDPEMALYSGADGLDLLRRFCVEAPQYLNSGGWVALEIGYDQGQALEKLLITNGFNGVEVRTDLSGIARFPIAQFHHPPQDSVEISPLSSNELTESHG